MTVNRFAPAMYTGLYTRAKPSPDPQRRSPVFQIRVPKALDPALTLAPIRITLGCVPNSRARRMADVLGGLARIEFARIENTPMNHATPADARRQVEDRLTLALPTLLGLGVLGQSTLPEEIAPAAIDGVFDLLAEVGAKRLAGDDNARRLRPEVPIVAALADENTAHGMLGLAPITTPPKPDPIMAELAAIRK